MRGISGTPTRDCISGDTGRGFIMPRGSRFPVAGLEAVAKVTVRTMRRLPGATRLGLKDGLRKDAVSGDRKAVEKTPEEIAISLCGFGN